MIKWRQISVKKSALLKYLNIYYIGDSINLITQWGAVFFFEEKFVFAFRWNITKCQAEKSSVCECCTLIFFAIRKKRAAKKHTHKSWMRRQYLIATKCDMSKWIGNKVSFEFDPLDLYSTSANSSSVFKCSNGASESQYNF